MLIEERADGLHISGYVNVTGKLSRPIVTPRGKVLETIEERAFDQAIRKSGNITVQLDHDSGHAYAQTSDGTLNLYEDAIGLHADVVITDSSVVEMAKKGKIKGWSFGMFNVQDELEQRAEDFRCGTSRASCWIMFHLSRTRPCYAATSVECRGEDDVDLEMRALDIAPQLNICKHDYSDYEERIKNL